MAKVANQKQKLLYIQKLLLEKTDEAHPITSEGIIAYLLKQGIESERKSIYNDIEALKEFGYDIICSKSEPRGYFIAERSFQLPELKLLIDSVQASRFLSKKKTLELIKKLAALGSMYEAELIKRHVYVKNRIKSMNESIYYNIDSLHTAIANNKKIDFKYYEYNVKKDKTLRKGGKTYRVSPFALIWDDENYYLIAYEASTDMIKHYRVDKMEYIEVSNEDREGNEILKCSIWQNIQIKTFLCLLEMKSLLL